MMHTLSMHTDRTFHIIMQLTFYEPFNKGQSPIPLSPEPEFSFNMDTTGGPTGRVLTLEGRAYPS